MQTTKRRGAEASRAMVARFAQSGLTEAAFCEGEGISAKLFHRWRTKRVRATNPAAPAADFQTNVFLPNLSAAAIEAIATATTGAPPNTRVFIVPFHGAITRVGLNDTAFPMRSFGFELDIMGRWADPADRSRAIEWVRGLGDSLQPFAHGAYVNQLGETSEELVRAAYGAHYTRLAAIKKKYDPKNVLR